MVAITVVEATLIVGQELVVEGPSPSANVMTVFEDDATTGYFYALDMTIADNGIVDALHIYNAADVTDGDVPSTLRIVWSRDGLKAALLINDYPHAVFDFEVKRSYCRTGFPPPSNNWSAQSHDWDDAALSLFE